MDEAHNWEESPKGVDALQCKAFQWPYPEMKSWDGNASKANSNSEVSATISPVSTLAREFE